MILRCVAAGLPEPEFAVTDGFVTTVRLKTAVLWLRPESQLESGDQVGPKLRPKRPKSAPSRG